MEMKKLAWKKCKRKSFFYKNRSWLRKFFVSATLVALWYLHIGAVENPSKRVVVGDSYAVNLSAYTGWDSCARDGASFDQIVSLILACDDWTGKDVHLLWGMAHFLEGTDKKVVDTETGLLEYLLKQKGAANVVVFTVDEQLEVHRESEAYDADDVHLNELGYKRLYEKKGLSLEQEMSSNSSSGSFIGAYQREYNQIFLSVCTIISQHPHSI
jgi:hypothetical protein